MADVPIIGGGETFEAFYRREFRSVLGLAVVLTGNAWVAEELTQEAFVAALRRWDDVRTFSNPGAWVRSVVSNRSASRFRRMLVHSKAILKLRPHGEAMEGVQSETQLDVWRAVRELPKRQAQTIALTYLDGLSRAEVGVVLGCSEETVKTHLTRARDALRSSLGNERGGRDVHGT